MNKAEVVERATKVEWALNLAEENRDIDHFMAKDVRYLIECINKLDEPKITEEQAWNKIAESYPADAKSLAVAFEHFYYEGFTKKEPRWVVKTDTGYLNYLELTPSKAFTVETSTKKEDAIFFYEELRANHFATLVDGIFEEVTDLF